MIMMMVMVMQSARIRKAIQTLSTVYVPAGPGQAGPEPDAGLSLKQQKELQSSVSIIQSQKPELFKLKLWELTS